MLGLGLWATLDLCLKEFALFSSSRKAEDSLTFALAGGEEDVAGEETDFL